ncbi:ammonium transporter Rh type B isoform X2 [Phaenicophaeus curvirostris]|uniref:ammonium transporter Rh type B isoform X2 n=1 Tax=Phaenicophaeus curvirostris TaxID=33595 RepID=UPI0037F0E6B6
MPEHGIVSRLQLSGLCFFLQILTIILFAAFVRYSPESSSRLCSQQLNCSWRNQDSDFQHPRFRDVHLQALLGFGLLVSFLSRYGLGSVTISILIVAFAIQWAVLIQGFLYSFLNGKIYVGAQSMVSADFCTAAVLISAGAVLGRANPIQMMLLTLLGVTLFTLNEYLLLSLMGVSDSGGSLTVHTFGAYFGLTVSRILRQLHVDKRKKQQEMGHQSDFFAVVGTIYLWIFWPSFTSATMVSGDAEPWALLNTYFSLASSTLATFVLLPVLYEENTPQMSQFPQPCPAPSGPDPGCRLGQHCHDGDGWRDAGDPLRGPRCGVSRWPDPTTCLQIPHAHLELQAENPGHVWGPQHPRAPGDPGLLAGDTAGRTSHCGCLRWQAGARVPAGGPGQPDTQRPGVLPALRPARHAAARHAWRLLHRSRPEDEGAEISPAHAAPGEHSPPGGG